MSDGAVPLEEFQRRRHSEERPPEPERQQMRPVPATWFENVTVEGRAEWVVKNLVPVGGLVEIYGQPGCGKSFLALHLGLAMARSIPFFGRPVVGSGIVAYIAAEGGFGIRKRIIAYRQHNGIEDGTPPFLLIPQALDLGTPHGADVDALVGTLNLAKEEREAPVVAVFIDTLSRTFGGGNENAPEDMTSFIRTCDRIGQEIGAARVVIHHEGKDKNGRGGRGHSSLLAATDAVLFVEKHEDGGHSFSIQRQKDGDDGEAFGFRLEKIELGEDEDGDPITSLVVEPTDDVPQRSTRRQLSPKNAAALRELQDLFANGQAKPAPASRHIPAGAQVVDLKLWREACNARDILNGANPRQQWNRIKEGLTAAGRIGIYMEQVWIAKQ